MTEATTSPRATGPRGPKGVDSHARLTVLVGDLFARKVSIENGARLSGRVDMDNAPAVPKIDAMSLGGSSETERELSDQEVGELLSGSSAA